MNDVLFVCVQTNRPNMNTMSMTIELNVFDFYTVAAPKTTKIKKKNKEAKNRVVNSVGISLIKIFLGFRSNKNYFGS